MANSHFYHNLNRYISEQEEHVNASATNMFFNLFTNHFPGQVAACIDRKEHGKDTSMCLFEGYYKVDYKASEQNEVCEAVIRKFDDIGFECYLHHTRDHMGPVKFIKCKIPFE